MGKTPQSTNSAFNIAENNGKINEEILKALKKLNKEAESVSGQNLPAIGIYHFLVSKVENDVEFAKKVQCKKLSACFSFVMEQYREQARELSNGTGTRENPEVVGIGASSDEIFDYVVDFYTLSDEELKKRAEEKAAARKAKAEKERKEREEKRKAEAAAVEEAKKEAEAKKKQAEKEKQKAAEIAEQGQMSFI